MANKGIALSPLSPALDSAPVSPIRETLLYGEASVSGVPTPLGVTLSSEIANLSIFSSSATGMSLLLFDHGDDPASCDSIRFDPTTIEPDTIGTFSSHGAGSPFDIADPGRYVPISGSTYIVSPHSAIILRYDYTVAA